MRRNFSQRRSLNHLVISIVSSVIMVVALVVLVAVGYLGVTCYNSNDPHSMACYMFSNMLSNRFMIVDR